MRNFLFYFFLLLGEAVLSTFAGAPSDKPSPSPPRSPRPSPSALFCPQPKTVQLWLGRIIPAGTLTVSWNSQDLIFDYVLVDVNVTEVAIDVKIVASDLTDNPGNMPVKSQATDKTNGDTEFHVIVNLYDRGINCGSNIKLYIAVHGAASLGLGTIWAWNKDDGVDRDDSVKFGDKGGWSHYFEYLLDCKCVPSPSPSQTPSPSGTASPSGSPTPSPSPTASPSGSPTPSPSPSESPSSSPTPSPSPTASPSESPTPSPSPSPSGSPSPSPLASPSEIPVPSPSPLCPPTPPKILQIWAGQYLQAGSLTVSWNPPNLVFDYSLNDLLFATEIQIYVGTTPPTTNDPGHFPVKQERLPRQQEYIVNVELSKLGITCQGELPLYIAVHAAGVSGETAWAWNKDGPRGADAADCKEIGEGQGWGRYFTYTVNCDCGSVNMEEIAAECNECPSIYKTDYCLAKENNEIKAGRPKLVIPHCSFEDLMDALKGFGCTAVPGCDTILCDQHIPDDALNPAITACHSVYLNEGNDTTDHGKSDDKSNNGKKDHSPKDNGQSQGNGQGGTKTDDTTVDAGDTTTKPNNGKDVKSNK